MKSAVSKDAGLLDLCLYHPCNKFSGCFQMFLTEQNDTFPNSQIRFDAAIKAAVSENSLPSGSAGFTESAVLAGTEVSQYICAPAALHLPAAGRSSVKSMLAGFRLLLETDGL